MEKITTPEQARAAIVGAVVTIPYSKDIKFNYEWAKFVPVEKVGEIIEAAMKAAYNHAVTYSSKTSDRYELWKRFSRDLQQA